MVPGFWVGTIVTAPAACTSIHQPSCTQQVCKPCPERESGLPGRHWLWGNSPGGEAGSGGIVSSCSSQASHPAGL